MRALGGRQGTDPLLARGLRGKRCINPSGHEVIDCDLGIDVLFWTARRGKQRVTLIRLARSGRSLFVITAIVIVKTGLRLSGSFWIVVVVVLKPQSPPEETSSARHAHGEHTDQSEKRCG